MFLLKLSLIFICGLFFSVLMYSNSSPVTTLLEKALANGASDHSSVLQVTEMDYETMIQDILEEKEERVMEFLRKSKFATSSNPARAEFGIEEMTEENTSESFNTIVNFDQDSFDNIDKKISREEGFPTTCREIKVQNYGLQPKLENNSVGLITPRQMGALAIPILIQKHDELEMNNEFLFKDPRVRKK